MVSAAALGEGPKLASLRDASQCQCIPSLGTGSGCLLTIGCAAGQIQVRRLDGAPQGAKGTISFTGNGHAASLPAHAVGDGLASSWLAEAAPSDMSRAVATVFAGPAPVEIALAVTAKLVTAPSPIPGQAFTACGG